MVVLEIAAAFIFFAGIIAILTALFAVYSLLVDKIKHRLPRLYGVMDVLVMGFMILLLVAMFLLFPLLIGDAIFNWQWFDAGVEK